MDGLGEALGRYESRRGESLQREEEPDKKPGAKSEGSKHHVYSVHAHKDGSHHLMIHHGGQLVHHSEHGSMEEAASAMQKHAAGGDMGEETGA